MDNSILTQPTGLPIPYEDYGACPFECCVYGEWIANKDTIIRKERDSNSPILFTVKRGEKIEAITGVVITKKLGRAKVEEPISTGNFRIEKGEIIYLLTYRGEGIYKKWFKGEIIEDALAASVIDKPESIWWIKIRNSKEQTGWSDRPENFDNKDACG